MSQWREASPLARLLLVVVLMTGATTFMFVPLLALRLDSAGLTTATVGLVAGLLAFSSQAFSLVIGWIVDRTRLRFVLAAGLTGRIAGYLVLISALSEPNDDPSVPALVVGVVCVGVGGSLLTLAIKIELVRQSGTSSREMLALRATFLNTGVVAGPALGAAVYPVGFTVILCACIASHLFVTPLLFSRRLTAPKLRDDTRKAAEPKEAEQETTSWRSAIRYWAPLLLLSTMFWLIYSQISVMLPLLARELTGTIAAASALFTINGILCVLFQYTLLQHVFSRTSGRVLLIVGFGSFAVAYAVLIPFSGWGALLAYILPMTFAELLIGPTLDQEIVKVGSLGRAGVALGAVTLAGSIGTLLGSWGGGYLLDAFQSSDAACAVLCGISLFAVMVCVLVPQNQEDLGRSSSASSRTTP
ncbi:MFS transporter [Pseudonocardia sp. ICBG1293]|uniref:MFS transporter n=1 Tax=Pseudonocardia sp. ICBG1293 TaxID=2844382 RepID=UPI0027E0E618|nr:MFS transporter [Pseudonocardia sp. ICBG1293]